MTKPFSVNELIARIRVALRHVAARSLPDEPLLEVFGLSIDTARRLVAVDGRELKLTPIEYKILVLLARNAGRVLTHRQIQREVWGPAHAGPAHTLRVHVAELRKKIEANPARAVRLMTEAGVGYRLRDRESEG